MLKVTIKILSIILSLSVLVSGTVRIIPVFAVATELNPQDKLITISNCSGFTGADATANVPVFAVATELNPQDKLITISNCSGFTGADATANVPDGEGMKVKISSGTTNSNNISASHMERALEFTRERLSNGAFVIYFGHDKTRILTDNTTDTAYADNVFMFRFDNNGTNFDIRIGGTADVSRPLYFISSIDGTVVRINTNNTSTKLPIDSYGNYHNEGYWVIPGASLQLSQLNDNISYSLTLLKCNPRNMTTHLSAVTASCSFYYDNFAFVDNIEDILGENVGGGYEYDSNSVYPVYKLGYITDKTEETPELSVNTNDITVKGLSGTTKLNLYRYGKYYASAETSAMKYTFTGLETGRYTVQKLQVNVDGKYDNASQTVVADIFDTSKLRMLMDYSKLIPYNGTTGNGTDCVPDGSGYLLSVSDAKEKDFVHDTQTVVELDENTAKNGALMFYFKHDKSRMINGVAETAYSYVVPTLIFTKEGVSGNKTLQIKSTASDKRAIYFISSRNGNVIRNETYNSASLPALDSDGNYYREGYWVIPMSAFTNTASDGSYKFNISDLEGYSLTKIKCLVRNLKSPTETASFVNASCDYYFDNFAYVDNIEDILGPINSGTKGANDTAYEYDGGSKYPVYTLGALDTPIGTVGLDKENRQVVRSNHNVKITKINQLADSEWTVNIYADNEGLIYSKTVFDNISEISISIENTKNIRIQIMAQDYVSAVTDVNRAGDIREDGEINIVDLVAFKKLIANSSSKYNSDMDGDGDTGAEDIVLLRRLLLGVDTDIFATDTSSANDYNLSNYPDYSEKYGVSELTNNENTKFFYQGKTYVYAITADGREKIALIDQCNGDWIDITNGAGTAVLYDSNKFELLKADGIKDFKISNVGDFTRLNVYYSLSGAASESAELVTTYTFKESTINVLQHIVCKSKEYEADAANSYIKRKVDLEYESLDPSVVGKWIYPSNGDYPYQISESTATILKFDDNHSLYTFLKSDKDNVTIYPPSYPKLNIPLSFEDGKNIDCTVEYDIVMATTIGGIEDNYYSLFRGRGSDYAVGVFPVTENSENSTMFVGNQVDLRLNVTNLVSRDVTFSLEYSIYDYYGNLVDSGAFADNTISKDMTHNREIHIEGNYGMYYLNLKASSDYYTHIECYPFALLRESTYEYRSTNPFGMTSIADNGVEADAMTAAKLNIKIGAGNYRFVGNAKGYQRQAVEYMVEKGIKVNVQLNMNSIKPTGYKTAEELVNAMNQYLPLMSDITDSIEVGNEINYSFSEGKEEDPDDYDEEDE